MEAVLNWAGAAQTRSLDCWDTPAPRPQHPSGPLLVTSGKVRGVGGKCAKWVGGEGSAGSLPLVGAAQRTGSEGQRGKKEGGDGLQGK